MIFLYLIANKENGKIYIGQTSKALSHRWRQHRNLAKYGIQTSLGFAIRHHSESSFSIREIDRCENQEEADDLEKTYIGFFRSRNPRYGYNMAIGGGAPMRHRKHSEQTKKLMSSTRTGRKIGPMTQEQKDKISRTLTGRPLSETTKEKMKRSMLARGVKPPLWSELSPEVQQRLSIQRREMMAIARQSRWKK